MNAPGKTAKVTSSTGSHSRQYIGQSDIPVMTLSGPAVNLWVLRFPSVLPELAEGLYSDEEIEWE